MNEEIRQLMAAGDLAAAEAKLKHLLVTEPDNAMAKMLYGTCRRLQGDEETFRRIHGELSPQMAEKEQSQPKSEEVRRWKDFHQMWKSASAAALVMGTVMVSGCMDAGPAISRPETIYGGPPRDVVAPASVKPPVNPPAPAYAGPPLNRPAPAARPPQTEIRDIYGGPPADARPLKKEQRDNDR